DISCAVVWLSALCGGHTLVPISPEASLHELKPLLRGGSPTVVVVEDARQAARLGCDGTRVLTRARCEALIWRRRAGGGAAGAPSSAGRLYLIPSGSTGEPKGVELSERQLAWTAEQVRRSHRLTPADRGLTVLPFFHINAPVVSLLASLLAGGTAVIAPR